MATIISQANVTMRMEVSGTVDDIDSFTSKVSTNPATPLSPSSTPAVTKKYSDKLTIGGSPTTLDLTSIGGEDWTGLKVQGFRAYAPATNSGDVTVEPNASNGYDLFKIATGEIGIPPGGHVEFLYPEGLADVGASDKSIDISGTTSDVLEFILIAG